MATPLSFRWPEDLVRRIDAARGDVPRSMFVRRAVERVLPAPSADSRQWDSPRPKAKAPRASQRPPATHSEIMAARQARLNQARGMR